MGKKYIIEIPEDKIGDFVGSTHFLMPYMMAGHIGHHDTGLLIEPYTEPDLEQVRKEAYEQGWKEAEDHYDDGYSDGYDAGLDDAWEAASRMNKCEIIERLKNIAKHAVHTVGEEPFVMSLDDGIAVHEAIELLKKPEMNCSEIPNNSDTTTHDSIPAKTGKNYGDGTSGDCISRQAAIEAVEKSMYENPHANDIHRGMHDHEHRHFLTILMGLPSAQPEQRWIPCSERQPDVNGWYITTISGEICGQDRAFSGMSEFANGKWTSGDDADETEMTIAWMPLPEPYQEGEQK